MKQPAPRLLREFNREWAFCYDPDPEPHAARAMSEEEGDFVPVALPHTWQTFETTGEVHPFVRNPAEEDNPYWWRGWGWYRKNFVIAEAHRGRRLFLEFGGVQKFCRVYCNGRCVGEHAGGFASFSVELTAAIRWGEPNRVAVAVSARQKDGFGGIPPMNAGNWAMYGGIYREARLVFTHPVHIPFQGSADFDGGVRVTTPVLSRERARVRVVTHVRNAGDSRRTVRVQQTIRDAGGEKIVEFSAPLALSAGEALAVTQDSPDIIRPRLWSPDDPYCHEVETLIVDGEQTLDEWHAPLGFRWFRWDAEENALYLNDKRVRVTGMNRHQEYPWLGDAVPWWLHERELHELRYDLGVNFARWCHYPNDRRVYDWCDRHGIIVCEEVPNIKPLPFDAEHQRRQVLEMIRRDRNHPCIIMWSMGNETDCAADGRWAREEDPERLIHYRHVLGSRPEADHTHEQLDMENLLRCTVRGWWEQDAMDPDTSPLPEQADNGQITGHEAGQHAAAQREGGSIRGRIDRDTVVWIYADHGADREYRHCPLKHVNPKGWVDAYRQPKEIYWRWQANRGTRLMAHIRAYFWRREQLGAVRDIVVDSNAAEVELFVGGRSLGTRRPGPENFFSVVFPKIEVVSKPLRVLARRDGDTVEETVEMAGEPAALRLRASHDRLEADHAAVALLTVDVCDAAGRAVFGARPVIDWELEGPGRLTAPAHWAPDINRRGEMDGTMYIITPVVMPVRAAGRPGTITVRVRAAGLRPAEAAIVSRAPAPLRDGIVELPPVPGDGSRLASQRRAARAQARDHAACIPMVYEDLHLDTSDVQLTKARLRRFLAQLVPPPAVEDLLEPLLTLARAENGVLIADDINAHLSAWFEKRNNR